MVTFHFESLTFNSTAAHAVFAGGGTREVLANKIMSDVMRAEGQGSLLEASSRRKPETCIV